MIPVQNYLNKNSLGNLILEHGIYASVSKNKRKISLNYSQIETKDDDIFSWDCRGLILSKINFEEFKVDINGNLDLNVIIGETKVLAFGMRRFFNYGQEAADINFNDPNLRVMEKLDGTMCQVYYDKFINEWHVATRSCPEADIEINSGHYTFRTLFEKALNDSYNITFSDLTSKLNKNITYCFELTSPYNRIVVDYHETKITLIAARNNISLNELDISSINIEVSRVRKYNLISLDDIVKWVSEQNPMEHEGVVIMDSNFRRIKVKNASYVAFNKARDVFGASDRNCLALVLSGKEDDVIPALPPEIVDRIMDVKQAAQKVIKYYDEAYLDCKKRTCFGDKKAFALFVIRKQNKDRSFWTSPMFSIYNGKASGMRDFIDQNCHEGKWSNGFLDKILDIAKKFRG